MALNKLQLISLKSMLKKEEQILGEELKTYKDLPIAVLQLHHEQIIKGYIRLINSLKKIK